MGKTMMNCWEFVKFSPIKSFYKAIHTQVHSVDCLAVKYHCTHTAYGVCMHCALWLKINSICCGAATVTVYTAV